MCPFSLCNHLEEEEKAGCFGNLLSYRYIVTINVLWPFLTVSWVGLQYVIVVFSDHNHLLFHVVSVRLSLILVKTYLCFAISSVSSELPALEFSQTRKISQYCKEWPLQSSANTDQVKFLNLRDVPN